MMTIKNKIEIIVPKEDNNGIEISSPGIKEAVNKATKIAGGNTITEVKGQWWSDDEQRIMEDDNLNIEWYYDKDMEDVEDRQSFIQAITKITRQLIVFYGQEAISIKIDGILYIVDYDDLEFLASELNNLMF